MAGSIKSKVSKSKNKSSKKIKNTKSRTKTKKDKKKATKRKGNRVRKKIVTQPLSISTLHDKLMEHLEQLRSKNHVHEEHKQPETVIKKIEVVDKKTNKPVLVLIHAHWCGHCQRLMPQWNEMKNHIIENNMYSPDEIKEIESEEQDEKLRELNEHYMIDNEIRPEGYPTMGKIVDGRFERYHGDRDTESLIRWAGGK